jgi:hypothetical protein
MVIRRQPRMLNIHRPPLHATVHLHATYNHQESCLITPLYNPSSLAYKRTPRIALLHSQQHNQLICLLSLQFVREYHICLYARAKFDTRCTTR